MLGRVPAAAVPGVKQRKPGQPPRESRRAVAVGARVTGEQRRELLACVDLTFDRLDGLHEYAIATGDASRLLVMHAAAKYARDAPRAAPL